MEETKRGTIWEILFDELTGKHVKNFPMLDYQSVLLIMATTLYDPKIAAEYSDSNDECKDFALGFLFRRTLDYVYFKTLKCFATNKLFNRLTKYYLKEAKEGGNAKHPELLESFKQCIIESIQEVWDEEQATILSLIKTSKLNWFDEDYARLVKELSKAVNLEINYTYENSNEDVVQRFELYNYVETSCKDTVGCARNELFLMLKGDPRYNPEFNTLPFYNPQKVEHY